MLIKELYKLLPVDSREFVMCVYDHDERTLVAAIKSDKSLSERVGNLKISKIKQVGNYFKVVTESTEGDFRTVTVYCPEYEEVVKISEGTGDNLSSEDMAEGFVDYIYYTQYSAESFEEVDGGQIMERVLIQDKYKSLSDAVPEVLSFAYGLPVVEYITLPMTA